MNDVKYYLIVDNSFGWQCYAVECQKNDKTKYPHYSHDFLTINAINVNFNDKGLFFSEIYSREIHFLNKTFSNLSNLSYYGWTISKKEFDTIKRICELRPAIEEYNRLVTS